MTLHALPFSVDDFGADVWRANELGSASASTVASGHPALDAQLPGGGWPVGALSEILQHHSGQHEWRLILPALMRAELGPVTVLVGAPHVPFGPGLAAHGFEAGRAGVGHRGRGAGAPGPPQCAAGVKRLACTCIYPRTPPTTGA